MGGRDDNGSKSFFLVGGGTLCVALLLVALLTACIANGARASFADESDNAAATAADLVPQSGSTSGADRYEPNDTAQAAASTGFPARVEATLHYEGDVDWYAIELDEAATVALTLAAPLGASYQMSLCDADGETITSSTYRASRGTQSIRYALSPGSYFVVVEGIDGSFDTEDSYTLNMQRQMDVASVSALDLSEMNMLTAMTDTKNSIIAWDSGIDGGGHFIMAQTYFSSWAGPVDESVDKYHDASGTGTFPYTDLSDQAICHVQNALYLPSGDDPNFLYDLKAAVMTYGAAQIYVLWAEGYVSYGDETNNGCTSLYVYVPDGADLAYENLEYRTEYDGGHALTVVGWDDNYSRSNFKGSAEWLEEYYSENPDNPYYQMQPDEKIKPQLPDSDGALICKNSWGSSEDDDGYVYVSYEDVFCGANNPAVFLAEDSADNYDFQYINDPKGTSTFMSSDTGESVTASEVFTNTNTKSSEETLRAVSFVTGSAAYYEISVTVGSGETQVVATGEKRYAGYYTIHIGDAALIEPGEAFRIDVTLTPINPGDEAAIGASWVEDFEDDMENGIESVEGRAFIDGEDAGAQGIWPNIRAYTDGSSSGELEQETLYGSDSSVVSNGVDALAEACAEVAPDDDASESDADLEDRLGGITTTSINTEQYGAIGLSIDTATSGSSVFARSLGVDLPETFDMRDEGTLTPVKDQGSLGSCWTFSAIACVENYLARTDANVSSRPRSLSLSAESLSVTLASGEEKPITLSATLGGTSNSPISTVSWSVSGDVDSVQLETVRTESGEEATILTALAPGEVTLRAESDADMSIAAECTITITAEDDGATVLPGQGSDADADADADATDAAATRASVSPDTGDTGVAAALITAIGALVSLCVARAARRKTMER